MTQSAKKWLKFIVRWTVAVVGIWIVLKNISLHDRAWVILDPATNRPTQVNLSHSVPEDALKFPVLDPKTGHILIIPRDQVINAPDAKQLTIRKADSPDQSQRVDFLGSDLRGDLSNPHERPVAARLLVAQPGNKTSPAWWVSPDDVLPHGYEVHVPYPRSEVGVISMVHMANYALLVLSVLVFPLTFIITSYRWHELLVVLDIHLAISRTFVLTMVGAFYNTFLPGSTGGDVLKAYYASKQTPHRTRAVMSVVVDRVIGLLALIVLGGTMAALQWKVPACKKVALGCGGICALTALGLFIFYNPLLHRLFGLEFIIKRLPMQKQVIAAVDTMQIYGRHPWLSLWSLIVSFPVHGAVITSAMFAGMAFKLPLHPSYYWVCVPVIVLSGAIPISPQGAGVMEFFAWMLTRQQGCTASQAIALTMSIRLVQVLWNLTGGLFVLHGGFHAPGADEQRELDNDGDGAGAVAAPAIPG